MKPCIMKYPSIALLALAAAALTACGGGSSSSPSTAPTVTAAAPTATSVSISGTAQVGQTLTGNYTYADANNDLQGTSTFRWLRNGSTVIVGATANTYVVGAADQGNTITFEVTPVALTGTPLTGTPVASTASASVTGPGTAAAPTANAVSISGTAQVGQTLTGNYTYADANNDLQGTSTFRWLRNGSTVIVGATANTYVVGAADQGNTITFEVTPVALTGTPLKGTPVASTASAIVTGLGTAAAPTANAVSISGTAQGGQTLTGNYTYADANNDLQGTSTFRWLRNGSTAIVGATANTYVLGVADVGNTITFEVTPVALTGTPLTGTPVASAPTASVTAVFISQGVLTWMPISTTVYTWTGANTYCTTSTINGLTGWRMPTDVELRALRVSGAMNGKGWMLGYTWTSTVNGAAATGLVIDMSNGYELNYAISNSVYVTCVR